MIIRKLCAVGALGAGLAASASGLAAASTSHAATAAKPAVAVQHAKASGEVPGEAPEQSSEPTAPEADGPGGHQDVSGQNADHQFNGTE
jgi:hypothetical protein